MRAKSLLPVLITLPLMTGGCVNTVGTVVTAPFKATAKVVDWTTTSKSEANRNYGKKMRKREAKEGRERRKWAKKCKKDPNGCGRYDGYRAY